MHFVRLLITHVPTWRMGVLRSEGEFTLAVSAFLPTHQGAFSLVVRSSRRVEVEPIPQEGAGMFAKTVHGEWCVTFLHPSPRFPMLAGWPIPLSTDFSDVHAGRMARTRGTRSSCPHLPKSSTSRLSMKQRWRLTNHVHLEITP